MNLIRYYQTTCYLLQVKFNDMIIRRVDHLEIVYNKYSHMKHVEIESKDGSENGSGNESEIRTYLNNQLHSFDDLPGLSWTEGSFKRRLWFKRGVLHRNENYTSITESDNQKITFMIEHGRVKMIQVIGQKVPPSLRKRGKVIGTCCYLPDLPISLNDKYEFIF